MPVKLHKILCATDLSNDSNRVVPYGLALARAFEAKLPVAHCLDLTPLSYGELFPHVSPDRVREMVRQAEERIRCLVGETDVRWEPLIVSGSASLAIAQAIDEQVVDLVITSTRSRPGLRRMILGSVTETILHSTSAPVLAIRNPEHEFLGPDARSLFLRRILVGCDFSADSEAAVAYGLSLARRFDAELHLFHSLEPTIYRYLNVTTGTLADDIERAVEQTVRQKLSGIVPGDKHPWCRVKSAFANGAPHTQIVKYAQREAIDLIIVGRRGQRLIEKLLVGSTADRVLRQASSPVLVVQSA